MKVEADPNQRVCIVCKDTFIPWSIAPDGEKPVAPPEKYTCMWCRFKEKQS